MKFTHGKYKNKSINWACQIDAEYCIWAWNNKVFNTQITELIGKNLHLC